MTESNVDTDAITKSLIDHFKVDSTQEAKAAKAAEEADKARGSSLRKLANYLAGINAPLSSEVVGAIAQTVGDRCAEGSGNPDQIRKVRKSEAKLLIEQRQHLPGIIAGLDDLNKTLDKPVNVRHKALQAARMIRSTADSYKDVTGAQQAVERLAEALTPKTPKSPEETLTSKLEALKDHKLLAGKPGVEAAIATLEAAIRTEAVSEAPDPHEDSRAAVAEASGLSVMDDAPSLDEDDETIEPVAPPEPAPLIDVPTPPAVKPVEIDHEFIDPDEIESLLGFDTDK